jgi:2-oxoisovalerate dehydrogenase E1 component
MRKEPVKYSLRGTEWKSEEKDLTGAAPHLLARMLFDIRVIHDFEQAVLTLKSEDCIWGPVHTSIGQEAIAAGTVAALKLTDKFFGTHRSHHQFLAKAMQYAAERDWNPARQSLPVGVKTVVRRTLAEIMGLSDGYCGGRGGSMHLRWKESGFLGSNAIVGGGIPLAAGAAFAEKFNKTGNIVVAFFGDGAINQGAFHEACNLAGLWNLPVIFFLENNEYAVATSIRDSCAACELSVQAASYGMDAHVVQGHDILAIYELIREVATGIRNGGPPTLVEAKCYRRYHHAGDLPGSAYNYRSKDEEKWHLQQEVTRSFPLMLAEKNLLDKSEIDHVVNLAAEVVKEAVNYYVQPGEPRKVKKDFYPLPESAAEGARSDGSEFAQLVFSEREDFQDFSEMKYSDAIASVTGRWLERLPNVIVLGEEIANFGGGAYGATKGLPEKYPGRVLNTPISEAGFTGLGLGTALSGMRTIIEIMFPDFTLVAADQVFNQIAKARHMYGNTADIPLVLRTRIAIGCGYGGQHSMDPVGLYALFSGWRIVAPANSFDYVGLFNSSMQSNDPVLIIEHHALYAQSFDLPDENLDYFIEFGKARIIEEGNDITLIAYGYMAWRLEKLSGELKKRNISAELIDLRTVDLPSLDFETLGRSLMKTGAAVIVEEAPTNHSIGAKIAAELTENYFNYLDSPVMRLSSLDVPNSVSRVLENRAILDDEQIVDMVVQATNRQWK